VADWSNASDIELFAAYCAGDDRAFEALYERYREWAFRIACRFARDEAEAADAVQDAFVYLIRRRKSLRLEGRFTTLLYPVLKSTGLALRRKSKRLKFGEGTEEESEAALPRPGEDVELARAIAALPDGQREVLLMRIVDGMSVEEVARALVVPEGTVKSRLHGAVKALKETLK
jgi:RNA polymerase sigma-70 factor, ECF subfamily